MTECTSKVPLSTFPNINNPPLDSIIPLIVSNGVGGYNNYRTSLEGIANAMPAQFNTFTGSPSLFTPSKINFLYVRTDVSPNILYRSTGISQGNLATVGGVIGTASTGGSIYFEYTIVFNTNAPSANQVSIVSNPNALTSSTIRLHSTPSNTSGSILEMLSNLGYKSILMLYGRSSGARSYLSVNSSIPYSTYIEYLFTRLASSGTFTNNEIIEVSIHNSPTLNRSSNNITSNTSLPSTYNSTYTINAQGSNITLTLPSVSSAQNIEYEITRVDDSSNEVILSTSNSFTDGTNTIKVPIYSQLKIKADSINSKWHVFFYELRKIPTLITSTTYQIKPFSHVYIFNCTSNNIVATLPLASIYAARIVIKLKDVIGGFGLTLNTSSTDKIDNSLSTIYLSGKEALILQSDGLDNWFII